MLSMTLKINRSESYRWVISSSDENKPEAVVYASENIMNSIKNDQSLQQLLNVASLPGVSGNVFAMPDIHQGYGFPIGTVAAFDYDEGIISPGGVGYDINCGVSLIRTGLKVEDVSRHLGELVSLLYKRIPSGTAKSTIDVSDHDMEKILNYGLEWAMDKGLADQDDLLNTELGGKLNVDDPGMVSDMAKRRGRNQLMTLGSGNHFLEIQKVDQIMDEETSKVFGLEKGEVTVMIHTGSRGLGHQVATDYLNLLNESDESVKNEKDPQLISAHIKSRLAERYMEAMNAAANFAYVNRQLITNSVIQTLRETLKNRESDMHTGIVYSLAHNIARVEEHTIGGRKVNVIIHRKGATRAFPGHMMEGTKFSKYGHPVLVPGSMGTASYVLVGIKGNDERSFSSSCHGAGRMLSRHAAISKLSARDIRNELVSKGISFKAANSRSLVEEAPESYKDVDEVVESARGAGLTLPVARLIPIGVMKG